MLVPARAGWGPLRVRLEGLMPWEFGKAWCNATQWAVVFRRKGSRGRWCSRWCSRTQVGLRPTTQPPIVGTQHRMLPVLQCRRQQPGASSPTWSECSLILNELSLPLFSNSNAGASSQGPAKAGLAALVSEERYRRPLLVGLSLMLFQQVGGGGWVPWVCVCVRLWPGQGGSWVRGGGRDPKARLGHEGWKRAGGPCLPACMRAV